MVGTALFYKPDDYFDVGGGWRRQPGGGPILLNLIHEVNNLLTLVGDIVRVQAVTSNATRGFPVEDTAAMVFTFANGALGTFLLSDTAASPRSWEQTSQENTSYPSYDDEDCYHIAGTTGVAVGADHAGPDLPRRAVVVGAVRDGHRGRRPQRPARQPGRPTSPRSSAAKPQPICSGRDGLNTLRVVDAVVEAARTGAPSTSPRADRRPYTGQPAAARCRPCPPCPASGTVPSRLCPGASASRPRRA